MELIQAGEFTNCLSKIEFVLVFNGPLLIYTYNPFVDPISWEITFDNAEICMYVSVCMIFIFFVEI